MLASLLLAVTPVRAEPEDDIRAAFGSFVDALNAHDVNAVDQLLVDSWQFLWIDPERVIRTRDDALKRFRELFKSGWRLEPHWTTWHVVMLDVSTAEIMLFVSVGGDASARLMRLSQVMVNTAHGWRVSTIVTDRPQADPLPLRTPPPRRSDSPNIGRTTAPQGHWGRAFAIAQSSPSIVHGAARRIRDSAMPLYFNLVAGKSAPSVDRRAPRDGREDRAHRAARIRVGRAA
jgi:ketosteroid isomerase-like protein